MDKNIVAFVREDTKTVDVKFFPSNFANLEERVKTLEVAELEELTNLKMYRYVTNLDVESGDLAMVYVRSYPVIVEIQYVHDTVDIEPNSSIQYKWLVAKIDMEPWKKLVAENDEIMRVISESYKASTKRAFKQTILGGLDEQAAAKLLALTSGGK